MNTSHDLPEQPGEHSTGHETPLPLPQSESESESAKFFQWLRSLGIQRGSSRWVGGVCSGLANKWGIDPVIVRGLAVVLTLFFGIGLLAYGVAWALLPEPDGRIHVEEVARGHWSAGMTGAGIITLMGLGGSGSGVFQNGDGGWFIWPLFWVAGIVWLIYWAVSRDKPKNTAEAPNGEPPAARGHGDIDPEGPALPVYGHTWQSGNYGSPAGAPAASAGTQQPYAQSYLQQPSMTNPQMYVKQKPRSAKPRLGMAGSLLVIGAAAVVGAAVLLLNAGHAINLGGYEAGVAAAAAAITAGLGIVAAGIAGRSAGGLGTFSVTMLVLAGLLSLPANNTPLDAFNSTSWSPTSAEAAEAGRTVVLGNATIDLTGLDVGPLPGVDVKVPLKAVTANLTVKVPADIPVTIKSELAATQFSINGKNDGGVLTQDMTSNVNPKAAGSGLVVNLQGVASNIDIVTVAAAP